MFYIGWGVRVGPGYAELHCHSNFSFLDGTSDPEALVERAVALGLHAIALTDRDGLYGIVRFAAAAKKHAVKAIVGAELTLESGEEIVLLVRDLDGYRNLCRIITHTRLNNPKDTPRLPVSTLTEHTDGLVALTRSTFNVQRSTSGTPTPGTLNVERETLNALVESFGSDSFFLETRRHLVPEDGPRNAELRELARELGVRCVAANDVRYATRDRAVLHDVVTSIRHRVPLDQAGLLLAPNHERCLKEPEEMARLFRDYPEELATTVEIAERCTFTMGELKYEFPNPLLVGDRGWGIGDRERDEPSPAPGSLSPIPYPPSPIPYPPTPNLYDLLVEAVWEGALRYYGKVTAKLQDRIVHELEIVKQLDLPGYLLVFKDIVEFCQREDILVSIRGSAPASVLLYCLGLSPIDPLEHGLLFERFASPERGEYPDIDLDIAHEERERVIQYVYRKYGRERAAMVCEVNTYRPKSAVRDVGFALGLPQHQIDRLAKAVDMYDSHSLTELLGDPKTAVGHIAGPLAERLILLCRQLLGAPRHLSIHVGGMIISARPLSEVVHAEPARMPDRTIIPWDKDDLATLAEEFNVNLIKLDLLGLGMLALVSRVIHWVRETEGTELRLHGFRYDPGVYDMICAADTLGLFQIESRAQMSFLPHLQPRDLHDVAISVGAIRPGPGAHQAGSHIARRRAGKEPVSYPHPDLVPVLEQTKGVILWQEQVMQVAMVMARYTPGEAERLRRAMTHKRSYEQMNAACDDLVDRMLTLGHPRKLAEDIRKLVVDFAGYGFPRAHAYPFAHLALVSATLKLRYPAAFYAALLNCQPMGFYAPHTIIWDAHRHGVRVLPVDVNSSQWDCTVEAVGCQLSAVRGSPTDRRQLTADSLRLGFTMVKGLGSHAKEVLERERANGPYCSIADFVRRTGLNRDEVERLAEVGAFLRFDERRAAVWRAGELAGLGGPGRLPGLADQIAEPAELPPMSAWEITQAEYAGLGLSTDHHLVSFYRPSLRTAGVLSALELAGVQSGKVRVGGLVICRQRPETAGEHLFMTLEDETGLVNVIVRPDVYRAHRQVFRGEPLLVVEGVLSRQEGVTNILARGAYPLAHDPAATTIPGHDFH